MSVHSLTGALSLDFHECIFTMPLLPVTATQFFNAMRTLSFDVNRYHCDGRVLMSVCVCASVLSLSCVGSHEI